MIPRSTTLTLAGRSIRGRVVVTAAGVVGVIFLGWVFGRGESVVVRGPDGSILVTDVNGAAGLAELATEMGIESEPLTTGFDPETTERFTTIAVLEPQRSFDFTPEELEALDSFLARGGRLVVSGTPPRGFLGRFLPADLSPGHRARVDSPVVYPLGGVGGSVTGSGIRHVETTEPYLPLLGDPPIAVAFPRREGVVVYISDGSILHNRRLEENGPWALAVLGEGPVLFDEVRHGFRPRPAAEQPLFLFQALPARAKRTMGMLALAGLVGLIAYGRRRIPVEQADRVLAPARAEFTDALAGLLRRTDDLPGAAAPLVERVGLLARRALVLDSQAEIDPVELARLLEVTDEIARRGLDPREPGDFLHTQHLLSALDERIPR